MRRIEFIVEKITVGRRITSIIGRCAGDALRVDDIFDSIYEYDPARSLEDYALPVARKNVQEVSLSVCSIRAYRRDLVELSSGMTARVALSGSGAEKLKEGWVLSGCRDG